MNRGVIRSPRLGLPRGRAAAAVAAAGLVWAGAAAGLAGRVPAAVAVLTVALAALRWRRRFVLLALAGVLAGLLAHERIEATLGAPLPDGRVTVVGVAAADPIPGTFGDRLLLRPERLRRAGSDAPWRGPPLVVHLPREGVLPEGMAAEGVVEAGVRLAVTGTIRAGPAWIRGDPAAGTVRAVEIDLLAPPDDVLFRLGNRIRGRVMASVRDVDTGSGPLLAGFLIGHTADIPQHDVETLRRSGLAHYVAVSGGNVALVLGAWWLALAPLGVPARARAALGLVVLAVFVVVTRWEPSVVRAGVMAAVLLVGRLLGVPVDVWTSFGIAVTAVLLAAPELATDVGFQLSAAATAGLVAGAPLFTSRRPKAVWGVLGATVSAQIAVMPIVLLRFGTIPAGAPLANLLAAPFVTAATAIGGIGAIAGVGLLVDLGAGLAGVVLTIGRYVADLPQLDTAGVAIAAGALFLARFRALRSVVLAGVAVTLVAAALPAAPPGVPTVVVLDVGQGDAILIRDPAGFSALVDGGSDPVVLDDALRRHRVHRLDLVAVTHGDIDHVGGLTGILDRRPVGMVWLPADQELGPVLEDLGGAAAARGIPVIAQRAGATYRTGALELAVLGPRRRYAAQNDGSLVLLVSGAHTTMLLPGDIEAVAQRELAGLRPDVMVVPHHGSATSDLGWLEAMAPGMAIVSVGANAYGHPAADVMATLAGVSDSVETTLERGDIVVELP